MAEQKVTEARLLVRYGSDRPGDTVKGPLAATLVERGMAKDTSPRTGPKKKRSKKAEAGAPENKEFKV
jgi:hypothetical protein